MNFLREHPLKSKSVSEAANLWIKSAQDQVGVYREKILKLERGSHAYRKALGELSVAEEQLETVELDLLAKSEETGEFMKAKDAKKVERQAAASALKITQKFGEKLSCIQQRGERLGHFKVQQKPKGRLGRS